MLTTKMLYSSGETKRYYSADRSKDYYVSEERQVVVSGDLAKRLGIEHFDKDQFYQLCDGINPRTGKRLTPRPKKGLRRVALDLTISPPKSVTDVIEVLGDVRAFDALSRANQDTLRLMEADASVRERAGGADHDRPTGNIIAYSFWDATTRPEKGEVDPHAHWHNIIANATYDTVKGREMALQLQKWNDNGLKLYRPFYEAYFNSQLRRYIEELGYKTRDTAYGFEIAGIPQEAIDEFSRRTAKINQGAEDRGITDPEAKGKLGAKLREGKIPLKPWPELVARWKERLSPEVLAQMEAVYQESLLAKPELEMQNEAAMEYARAHHHYRQSAVPERVLFSEAMRHNMGHVTLEGLRGQFNRPGLIREELNGVWYVTDRAIKAEEDTVVEFARATKGKLEPLGKPGAVLGEFLPGTNHRPTVSQANAFKHVVNSRDPITLVLGKPGAGKTEVMKALRIVMRKMPVFIAPTAAASRENLVEAGFSDAETVAAFERSQKLLEQARDGVVFLDEGSLAGSVDMAAIVKLAIQYNFRLVIFGDTKQHKSASRGDTLKLLLEHARLPFAHLAEIVRQRGELLKAVELLYEDKVADGLTELDGQGRIRIGSVADFAQEYLREVSKVDMKGVRHRKKGVSVQVISPTHAGGRAAAAAIRSALKESGLLKGDEMVRNTLRPLQFGSPVEMRDKLANGHVAQFFRKSGDFKPGDKVVVDASNIEQIRKAHPESYALNMPDHTAVMVGDLIRATNNAGVAGGRVNNGSLYEVESLRADGGIKLTNGLILPPDFQNFTQGYVQTSPGSQSRTKQAVLIWQPSSTRGATYFSQGLVSISRGAKNVLIFTDNKDWLPQAVGRVDERVLASDLVQERRKKRMKKALAFRNATVNISVADMPQNYRSGMM